MEISAEIGRNFALLIKCIAQNTELKIKVLKVVPWTLNGF